MPIRGSWGITIRADKTRPGPADQPPAVEDLRDFPYQSQLPRLWWCWVASVTMVLLFFRKQVKKCEIAGYYFRHFRDLPLLDCCLQPLPDACDQGCDWDDITGVYQHYGIGALRRDRVLKLQAVKTELLNRRPIQIQVGNMQLAHQVVIRGYQDLGRKDALLFINDPQREGIIQIRYSQLAKKFYRMEGFKWQCSWTFQAPAGGNHG